MNVRFSLIADAANISVEGKLNVLGEFNKIYVTSIPSKHAMLCYVVSLEMLTEDLHTTQQFELRYLDEDGAVLAPPLDWKIQIGDTTTPGEPESRALIIPIMNLGIPGEGRFAFELRIDGVVRSTCTFTAAQLAPPAS